jgi:signal-transduction protein with cAMP-binding, CBS, and nucleotidyltransferase domain
MEDLYPTQIPLKELLSKKSLEKIHNVLSPVYFKKDTLLIKDSKLEKNAYFIQKGIIRAL